MLCLDIESSTSAASTSQDTLSKIKKTEYDNGSGIISERIASIRPTAEVIPSGSKITSILPCLIGKGDSAEKDVDGISSEHEQILQNGEKDDARFSQIKADSNKLPRKAKQKSWIMQYLWCVIGTAAVATIAGVGGAFVYQRTQRNHKAGELSLPLVDAQRNRLTESAYENAVRQPGSLSRERADFISPTKLQLQQQYRGRYKRTHYDITRLDPPDPESRGGDKDTRLRLDYLNRLACSDEQRAERRTLIHKANQLTPGTALELNDVSFRNDQTEFTIPYVVFTAPKVTTTGWWLFKKESTTTAVFIKPLFKVQCEPIELKP